MALRLLLPALLALCGCAGKQPARIVIPQQCSRVKITDFHKPCVGQPDGSLLCDHVSVHADCIATKK